jgi:protein-S-isoprenylcysteine O-methyltransferase Ste14
MNWPPDPAVREMALGGALAVLGAMLTLSGAGMFRRAKTNIVPFSDPSALVRTGPFRFTRNPMYLGLVLLSAAPAVGLGELANLFAPALLWAWLHVRFVLPEERFMTQRFGAEYEAYRRGRPRWIWPL